MAAKKLSNAYLTIVGDKEVTTRPSSVFMERLDAQKAGTTTQLRRTRVWIKEMTRRD